MEFIALSTGTWALSFLLASLSITPLRVVTRMNWLIRLRRLIGLFSFFYAVLHFFSYIWLDKFFDLREMAADVLRQPFITAGVTAFLLLVPLAATSTAGAIRRLGGRMWQMLHRLVYASAAAAVLHYWWKVKADTREPAIYAAVLCGLLAFRLIHRLHRRSTRAAETGILDKTDRIG